MVVRHCLCQRNAQTPTANGQESARTKALRDGAIRFGHSVGHRRLGVGSWTLGVDPSFVPSVGHPTNPMLAAAQSCMPIHTRRDVPVCARRLLRLPGVHPSPRQGAPSAAPQSDAFIRVLLVENADSSITQQMLAHAMPASFQTVHVRTLDEALRVLGVARFDVVLLDLVLPDADGVAALTAVGDANAGAPIIALTAPEDLALGDACIREGAQDCLIKNELTGRALARSIRYAIARVRNQEALRQLSLTDELTGLYNRRGLGLLGEQQLKLARRSGRGFVLATIDLDGLKGINDTFGHQEGDVAHRADRQHPSKHVPLGRRPRPCWR